MSKLHVLMVLPSKGMVGVAGFEFALWAPTLSSACSQGKVTEKILPARIRLLRSRMVLGIIPLSGPVMTRTARQKANGKTFSKVLPFIHDGGRSGSKRTTYRSVRLTD